jgi:hypothetical protein
MQDPQLQGSDKVGELRQRVRGIILETFDFEEMSRVTLRGHWDRLTALQQTEFVILLGNPFECSYNHLVLRFLPKRETTYGTKSIEQDRAVVQTTLIVHKTDE